MNFYDEEIILNGADTKNLNSIKVERLPSSSSQLGSGRSNRPGTNSSASHSSNQNKLRSRQRTFQSNSTDDDGLLQDIIDHDDEDEDDDDDSDIQKIPISSVNRRSASQRPQTRPGSIRAMALPTAKVLENDTDLSDTESDDIGASADGGGMQSSGIFASGSTQSTANNREVTITPENWEKSSLHQEVKELFPYILKYTPQQIDASYVLQPFIPDYIPAVGDVDAFLKVTIPPLLHAQRQTEVNAHLQKMGLHFLDEPSGEQSEPSLLNMKLRSVLTGSGINPRSASAALIPTAKASKDIDKWIAEVEQVHMQSVYDALPRKDIDALILDWPKSFAESSVKDTIQNAYQRCLQNELSLTEYIRLLSQLFNIQGPLESQADYIVNVHTIFALYLAANQAWE